MKVELITKFEDFLKLENIWNNLLEKSQSDYVCLTFEWFKSWWLSFGKDKSLFIFLVKDESDIVGIAPLMISHVQYRGLPVREIGFIQNENSPRSDFILSERQEEAIETIFDYLKSYKENWDIIRFSNLPKESLNYEILQKTLIKKDMLFGTKEGLISSFLQIQSDWKTYSSSLSKKFRKTTRNNINRMERLGSYRISKIEDINNNEEVLTNIFKISKNSWKAKYGKEITNCEENRRFFEELSKISCQRGWLNIWLLNVNGRAIAYEYHLKYKNRIYALRADFDEEYRTHSPGSVLDSHIVKYSFENNLKEYDMCGSADAYKKSWTSMIREHAEFIIYKDNLYGQLIYLLEFKVISFLKKIKFLKKLRSNFIYLIKR